MEKVKSTKILWLDMAWAVTTKRISCFGVHKLQELLFVEFSFVLPYASYHSAMYTVYPKKEFWMPELSMLRGTDFGACSFPLLKTPSILSDAPTTTKHMQMKQKKRSQIGRKGRIRREAVVVLLVTGDDPPGDCFHGEWGPNLIQFTI